MSLINRMLRDLASRQPPSGEMLHGIQLSPAVPGMARPRTRWGMLAVVAIGGVAVVAAAKPLMVKRAALPVPQPRSASPSAVAAAPAPPLMASAAAPVPASRFHLDTTLSESAGKGAAPAVAAGPPPKLRLQQGLSRPHHRAQGPAAVASAAPATAPTSRDARASQQRAEQGAAAQAAGQVKSAEQQYRDALALNPNNHEAREKLAKLLLDEGRLKEAQAVLDDGLLLAPMRNSYRRLAARLDLALGAPGAAVQRLEPQPPAVAEDPEYHGLLAAAYQRMGLHQAASRTYESLLQAQPGEGNWWAGYGISKEALGQSREALNAYTRARQVGRLDPRVREYITQRSAALQAPKS